MSREAITLPAQASNPIDTVVVLETDGPAQAVTLQNLAEGKSQRTLWTRHHKLRNVQDKWISIFPEQSINSFGETTLFLNQTILPGRQQSPALLRYIVSH